MNCFGEDEGEGKGKAVSVGAMKALALVEVLKEPGVRSG
jgi:hypothetical protein